MEAHYRIPWKPRAKQRPRVKNNVAYTPKETREAERQIREAFEAVNTAELFEGPIAVTIRLADEWFEISIVETDDYKQRKLRGDIDNYAKTILDSLNGIAWVDDKQITHLEMEKL